MTLYESIQYLVESGVDDVETVHVSVDFDDVMPLDAVQRAAVEEVIHEQSRTTDQAVFHLEPTKL